MIRHFWFFCGVKIGLRCLEGGVLIHEGNEGRDRKFWNKRVLCVCVDANKLSLSLAMAALKGQFLKAMLAVNLLTSVVIK